ncbi:MAG: hypothetical protein ACXU84_14875, partial [Xanthobacteraceae bacterium]
NPGRSGFGGRKHHRPKRHAAWIRRRNSRKFLQDRVHDPLGFVAAAARAWSMRGPPWTSPRASIAAFGNSFVDLTTAAWCR